MMALCVSLDLPGFCCNRGDNGSHDGSSVACVMNYRGVKYGCSWCMHTGDKAANANPESHNQSCYQASHCSLEIHKHICLDFVIAS